MLMHADDSTISTASRPRRSTRRRRAALATVFAATLATVGAALPPAPAAAEDFVRIGTWDYPADLHDLTVSSLGQSFTVETGDPVNVVGGVFANYGMTGSGFTMTLKDGGPSGTTIATESYADIRDNAWVELELDESLDPGTYYLEATDVVGLVAWWSNTPNVFADGTAYHNGTAVSGDRTLVLRNDDPVVVPPPPVQAGFVDGVADGITIQSEGIEIRRDDQSGFSYDYAPSVIVENGVERAWWCGHNVNGDGVYYAERTQPSGEWSEPDLVLRADQTWEAVHVCDPSVIAGDFTVEGVDYDYLMLYGAADLSGQNTKLGSAFSNDGVTWHKPLDDALLEEPGMIYDYGVGMPALFGHDGDVYVAYYDTGRNSAAIVREVLADGTLGADLTMLPVSSGDTFADLAFSEAEQKWYLATKAQRAGISDEESYVYVSRTADLATTEWVHLGIVGEYLTGYPMNHNAGWYRTAEGALYEPAGVKRLIFGAQDGGQGTWDPDKWELGVATISGTPTGTTTPGAFGLSTPADSAVIDPLAIDGFAWTPSAGATSYTLRIGEDPSLSSGTVALATTGHLTSTNTLEQEWTIGSTTQRMALLPARTYYWNVTAVSPAGTVVAQTAPRSFETTPDYDLDLTAGGYVPWQVVGDATFTPGEPASLSLPTAESALRTGADFNPARIAIGELNSIEFEFASGSNAGALGDLVLSYRLQSESRDTPVNVVHTTISTGLVGDTLTVDLSGLPGWGVPGAQIAQLTIGTTVPGALSIERISVSEENPAP